MNDTPITGLRLGFDNSYAASLDGFYTPWEADRAPNPTLIHFNKKLALDLGLDPNVLAGERGAAIFSGNVIPTDASPIAQVYAGHQFGAFSPQLGDGRALLLGELVDTKGTRRDIQLKGSGRTPYSRGGDGKAAMGPVLREYLIAEAMHALGVPTTRALAAVTTGELIYREKPLPGAILTRVAKSHIRVGTFQFFAARGEHDRVRQLADYVIQRHYPGITTNPEPYLELFRAIADRQAKLIAKWMGIGFIHGVMNTDNMAISGETIDYGPCAFMDTFAPNTFFSSIDSHGRYAYGAQPSIAQWNLTRFAETLISIVDGDQDKAVGKLTEEVKNFRTTYMDYWLQEMRGKLGLQTEQSGDLDLITDLFQLMADQKADFTSTFRSLANLAADNTAGENTVLTPWLPRWLQRLSVEGRNPSEITKYLLEINPAYIPRNHKVEEALEKATNENDLVPFFNLLDVVTEPYNEKPNLKAYLEPAPPETAPYRTFCGT